MICIKYVYTVADYQGVNIFINCTCIANSINKAFNSGHSFAQGHAPEIKLSAIQKRFFPILLAWLLIDNQSSADEPRSLHNEIASYAPDVPHAHAHIRGHC